MLRGGVDPVHAAALLALAVLHDQHIIAKARHYAEIVGNEDDGGVEIAAQFLHQVKNLRLHRDVQRRGGLVRDQQCGGAQQRRGDRHSLAHAAGQLVRPRLEPFARVRYTHGLQQLPASPQRLPATHALVQFQNLRHLHPDLQVRVQRSHGVLENHRDPIASDTAQVAIGHADQFAALEPGASRAAAVVGQKAHEAQHRLALARAGLAHNAQGLPRLQVEVDAAHRMHDTVRRAEIDLEIANRNQRHVRRSCRAGPARRAARRR